MARFSLTGIDSFSRSLSDYPCAGCKTDFLVHILAPFWSIATAMNLQMS